MLGSLEILDMAAAMARHAGARQNIIAQNVANADTQNYKARDIGSFTDAVDTSAPVALKATRKGHVGALETSAQAQVSLDQLGENSPNGNSVSIENEILKSVEAEREHARALAIYQSSMSILKTAIGRGR